MLNSAPNLLSVCSTLKILDLSDNNIVSISNIFLGDIALCILEELDLSNNRLSCISEKSLINELEYLQSLNVSDNSIERIIKANCEGMLNFLFTYLIK